jgi:phage gpG-like protein
MEIDFKTDFFNRLEKINKPTFMRRLVNRVGVVAVNFSKERFVKKDWLDGSSRQPWAKRKRKDKGSLLVKSGRLKRSIRKISEGDFFVYVGTDVPYAQIHNEGGEVNKITNVRSHTRTRKRQFLGDSDALAKRIERFAVRELDNEISQQ